MVLNKLLHIFFPQMQPTPLPVQQCRRYILGVVKGRKRTHSEYTQKTHTASVQASMLCPNMYTHMLIRNFHPHCKPLSNRTPKPPALALLEPVTLCAIKNMSLCNNVKNHFMIKKFNNQLILMVVKKLFTDLGIITYYDIKKTSCDCFDFIHEARKIKQYFTPRLNFKILIIYCSLHTI